MMRHEAGMAAKTGFYWDLTNWAMVMVPKEGGVLPGETGHRFFKVPVIGLLVAGPMMGALYVFFLPFIGFAMVFNYLVKKGIAALKGGVADAATTMSPAWRPGEAYLAKKDEAIQTPAPAASDLERHDGLDHLQKDIDEARK